MSRQGPGRISSDQSGEAAAALPAAELALLPSYTLAGLPAAGTANRLAGVTDDVRGPWMDQGSQWFSLSGEVVNVKEFGAKGDGTTDDSSAIQAALNAAAIANATVGFQDGIYAVATKLTWVATSPGATLRLVGYGNVGRGTGIGASLKWIGAVGGTLFETQGANRLTIERLQFDGNNSALKDLVMLFNTTNTVGSSGILISDSVFLGATGTNSAMIELGDATNQVSEVRIRNSVFLGFDVPGMSTYGILTRTGNTKNFSVIDNAFTGFSYAISFGRQHISEGSSGAIFINHNTFGNSTGADIYIGVGSQAVIQANESENCARFIVGPGASTSSSQVTLIGNSFQAGIPPADDYVILTLGAQLTMIGNSFNNVRTEASIAKIQVSGTADNTTNLGSIVSIGNFYKNASGAAPLFDGSNNDLLGATTTFVNNQRIFSLHDTGGVSGALSHLQVVFPSQNCAHISPTQITADQNNYNPGTAVMWRLSSDAARNITGIGAGRNGKFITIVNVGANNVVLQNQNAGSVAANRIITGTGADVTLAADDTAQLFYDNGSQRWRVINTH